jgi:N6-adenosine-specific RNA methylase IME4
VNKQHLLVYKKRLFFKDKLTIFTKKSKMNIIKLTDYKSSVAKEFISEIQQNDYKTILADPPWRFLNRTGKMAPEHKRLNRYPTLHLEEIKEIPVHLVANKNSHLYLWVPNALLNEGLEVMDAWGFKYKSNLIWHKVRKDGGPDGRGVGFYFRNTTEIILFGIRGSMRTLQPGRRQVNIIRTQKQEHSRKPDELYNIIESCSPGPYLEIFARGKRKNWDVFGNQAAEDYAPKWDTYKLNSSTKSVPA